MLLLQKIIYIYSININDVKATPGSAMCMHGVDICVIFFVEVGVVVMVGVVVFVVVVGVVVFVVVVVAVGLVVMGVVEVLG